MSESTGMILNKIASEVVLMENIDISSLEMLMDLVDGLTGTDLNDLTAKFKEILLDGATGEKSGQDLKKELSDIVEKMQFRLRESSFQKKEKTKKSKMPEDKKKQKKSSEKKGESKNTKSGIKKEKEKSSKKEKNINNSEELFEDPELVEGFVQESREHLETIEQNVLDWENNPEDSEIINTIFRAFHTIKGMAGFLNIASIQHLSHQLENVLDALREGKIVFSSQIVELVLNGVDVLGEMINGVESRMGGKKAEDHIKDEDIEQLLEKSAMILNQAKPKLGEVLLETKKIHENDLKKALERQASGDKRKIGEILVEEKKVDSAEIEKALTAQAKKSGNQRVAKSLRVDTTKMDSLFDMVGELVITRNILMQNEIISNFGDEGIQRSLAQLNRITKSLQNITLSLRMVPIGETLRKMRRVVRDLSKKSGKKIQLVLKGESTEIDRNLVDSIYDPLIHMVRNSCDHGIESPEERKAKGKSDVGTIEIGAYQEGGHIVIEVKDDGKGIDPERIKKKAIEKGLISPKEKLDIDEIYHLIFKPGFTTSHSVSNVSGRGVGMDVVKRVIGRLGGRVEVKSKQGEGTIFTIKLPLTLAIVDGIMVKIGEEKYIIPAIHIRESLKITRSQYTKIAGKGETVRIREHLFPLIRLYEILGVREACTIPWEGVVIIVETEFNDVAFLVDDIYGKQEVVIKNLGDVLKNTEGVSGGAVLGDGQIGLILDVNKIEMLAMGLVKT